MAKDKTKGAFKRKKKDKEEAESRLAALRAAPTNPENLGAMEEPPIMPGKVMPPYEHPREAVADGPRYDLRNDNMFPGVGRNMLGAKLESDRLDQKARDEEVLRALIDQQKKKGGRR